MKKKLLNPFMLGLQGFVAGAALFWSFQSPPPEAPSSAVPAQAVRAIAGI